MFLSIRKVVLRVSLFAVGAQNVEAICRDNGCSHGPAQAGGLRKNEALAPPPADAAQETVEAQETMVSEGAAELQPAPKTAQSAKRTSVTQAIATKMATFSKAARKVSGKAKSSHMWILIGVAVVVIGLAGYAFRSQQEDTKKSLPSESDQKTDAPMGKGQLFMGDNIESSPLGVGGESTGSIF